MNWIRDFIVRVISGLLSGWMVSIYFKKKADNDRYAILLFRAGDLYAKLYSMLTYDELYDRYMLLIIMNEINAVMTQLWNFKLDEESKDIMASAIAINTFFEQYIENQSIDEEYLQDMLKLSSDLQMQTYKIMYAITNL